MAKTLKEASDYLGKSERTISRYIKRGFLKPERATSAQGTLEYRFNEAELEGLKKRLAESLPFKAEQARQDTRQEKPLKEKKTRQDQDNTQTGLQAVLASQLEQKDRQIEQLTSLLAMLQNKVLQIEAPKEKPTDKKRQLVFAGLLLLALAVFIYFNILPSLRGLLR